MSKNLHSLVQEHHAFYEVSPYHLVLADKPGSVPAKTRTIQAGFDVDIFGVNMDNEPLLPGPDYALGYAEVRKVAEQISQHTTGSCSLEVIPFPSRITFGGASHNQREGMLRIRIFHHRGLDQPADAPEEEALKEVEKHLRELGVMRK